MCYPTFKMGNVKFRTLYKRFHQVHWILHNKISITITWNRLLEISLSVRYVHRDVLVTNFGPSEEVFVENCTNMKHNIIILEETNNMHWLYRSFILRVGTSAFTPT
jgi:hypothetical protein